MATAASRSRNRHRKNRVGPYISAVELATANGLLLGITADIEYGETNHLLAPEDILVLISDGVVEARDKKRHLYGFERLQQTLLEKPSAHAIAKQAQQFGQDDDITVISISRHATRQETPRTTLNQPSLEPFSSTDQPG